MRWIVGMQHVMRDKTPQTGEIVSILDVQVTNWHGSAHVERGQKRKIGN